MMVPRKAEAAAMSTFVVLHVGFPPFGITDHAICSAPTPSHFPRKERGEASTQASAQER